MGFGKAFGLGFLIYVALNFVFALIVALLAGTIDLYFSGIITYPMVFISSLFIPILVLPGDAWLTLGIIAIKNQAPNAAPLPPPILVLPGDAWLTLGIIAVLTAPAAGMLLALIVMIGLIVPPILAAIIAGRTGGGKGAAFGAWFLIAIISAAVPLVLGIIAGTLSVDVIVILTFILSGVINGLLYGAIAALSASEGF